MEISEWPSICCSERRSAPLSNKCVANACLRICGDTRALIFPKTTYLFNIKNTLINKVFLWFVRKKLNKATYNLILRGRHPNRKELFKQIGKMWSTYDHNEVPIKYAKTIGVYLREKNHGRKRFSKNIRK